MAKLLLFVVIVAAVVFIISWQGRQYQAFMQKAQKISGEITAKETRTFRPNQQTGKESWASYRFTLDGKEYQGEEKVEFADIWHDLKEGQPVDIYYNRDNPAENHLAAVMDHRVAVTK